MKVRMLTARCGPGGNAQWGDIVDLDNAEAERLVATRQAEYVVEAVVSAPENAAHRTGKPKGYKR